MGGVLTCKGSYTNGAFWSAVTASNKLGASFVPGKVWEYAVLGAYKQSNEVSFAAKFGKDVKDGSVISGSAQYTPTKDTTIRFAAKYNLNGKKNPEISTGVSHSFTKGVTVVSFLGPNKKGDPVCGLQFNLES